jgi:hypothetical protein
VQPIPEPPFVAETDEGYADQLFGLLAAKDPKLELVKLGCEGESTVSMQIRRPERG